MSEQEQQKTSGKGCLKTLGYSLLGFTCLGALKGALEFGDPVQIWTVVSLIAGAPIVFLFSKRESFKSYPTGLVMLFLLPTLFLFQGLNQDSTAYKSSVREKEAELQKARELEATPSYKLCEIARESFKNGDTDNLLNCDVTNDGNDRSVVVIAYKDEYSSKPYEFNLKLVPLMKKVYTAGFPISGVKIIAHTMLVDNYGHAEDGVAYKVVLDRDEGNKINWNMEDAGSGVLMDVVPRHWTAYGGATRWK